MKTAVVFILVVLAGCASQIMQGYVGKDITEVVLDRGPPAAAFDLPNGQRAFQWRVDSVTMMPTTTTVNGYGSGSWYTATAVQSGGGIVGSTCIYTLFGQRNAQKSYTITGFRQPTLDCE